MKFGGSDVNDEHSMNMYDASVMELHVNVDGNDTKPLHANIRHASMIPLPLMFPLIVVMFLQS